jgi:hypothetical protein
VGGVASLIHDDPVPGICYGTGISLWVLVLWVRWRREVRRQQNEQDRFRMVGLKLSPVDGADVVGMISADPEHLDQRQTPPTGGEVQ